MNNSGKKLLRLIMPAFPPLNAYDYRREITTSLGLICVGSSADQLPDWDVEIIDENNLKGKDGANCPRDKNNLPNHDELQNQ